ncbi:hypothetical protein J7E70_08045 [Variovorax paradoxus]|nr:hypothetical protein [Variovorax paradoxus]MBT2300415.1 hypothetical protein [Variovorax paradoxus]
MIRDELIAWQRREQTPIEKALRRAYSLGQTYWQQADSESYSQNKKSDETAAKFEALVSETVAASPPAPAGQAEGALDDAFDCALAALLAYTPDRSTIRHVLDVLRKRVDASPPPVVQQAPVQPAGDNFEGVDPVLMQHYVRHGIAPAPQPAAQSAVSDEQIDAVGAQFYGNCYTPADRQFAKQVLALASSAQAGEPWQEQEARYEREMNEVAQAERPAGKEGVE